MLGFEGVELSRSSTLADNFLRPVRFEMEMELS
jgi:hypothetical protein